MDFEDENFCVWLKGLSQIENALSDYGSGGDDYDEATYIVGKILEQLEAAAEAKSA